jgi:hypothetical protein
MSDGDLVSFRTGDSEIYFEALKDMADDGYFNGNFSEGIRNALSAYLGDGDFPSRDFEVYFEARAESEELEEAREELLDQKFFGRAVVEFLEKSDYEGLDQLAELYADEKLTNPI